jgi:hypothetical protein
MVTGTETWKFLYRQEIIKILDFLFLSGQIITHQSWTLLKDSSLVMSYISMKPMAPR